MAMPQHCAQSDLSVRSAPRCIRAAAQTPPAPDPGPEFPPLVAPVDVDDGAAAYAGGALNDDVDDVDQEQGISDGEDEEMIMLHVRSTRRRQQCYVLQPLTSRLSSSCCPLP